jgi:inorganic triphosphatase YgiF
MPTPPEAREVELKFELSPEALEAARRHPMLAEPARGRFLSSVYFDTPDEALKAAGLALRIRTVDGRHLQTLKGRHEASGVDRDEWEAPVPRDTPDPAALPDVPAARLVQACADRLKPVFATEVQRSCWRRQDGEAEVEICLDVGETRAGRLRAPICELELELRAGAPDYLFALARTLGHEVDGRLSFVSKAERGYRLATGQAGAPVKAAPLDIAPDLPAADAFRRIAWSCLTQAEANAATLRAAPSPEVLHQARVGIRRLRAAASAFKAMLGDGQSRAVLAELKWLAGELDTARDLDVLIDRLFPDGDEGELGEVHTGLVAARAAAYERALAAVSSRRFGDLLLDLAAWLPGGDWSRDEATAALRTTPASAFGAEALGRLVRKAVKAGRGLADLEPEARHAFRIRIKKLRYGAEFFLPAMGDAKRAGARKLMETIRTLQESLGDLNDIAVARAVAQQALAGAPPATVFAAGLAVGQSEAAEADLLDKAVVGYRKLKRAAQAWDERRAPG